MSDVKSIKILNAALDEAPGGELILRGVIAPDSLQNLQVADYQREASPLTSLRSLLDALAKNEALPDIELGMRGQSYTTRDGVHFLRDDVYIIDGLQRTNAAIHFMKTQPGREVHLGAMIHFDTDEPWERERFEILNTKRVPVAPNILLRNKRETSPFVSMLHALTENDRGFALVGRVSWGQRMQRGTLLTAYALAQVVGQLHGHKTLGIKSNRMSDLVPNLDKAVDTFGLEVMRANVKAFFELIDEAWGVRRIQYREGAAYMRTGFLKTMARLMSDHHDFWRQPEEKRLVIQSPLAKKISLFPVHDPNVMVMAATSSNKTIGLLYHLMRLHINSGKRSMHLRPRTEVCEPSEPMPAPEGVIEMNKPRPTAEIVREVRNEVRKVRF